MNVHPLPLRSAPRRAPSPELFRSRPNRLASALQGVLLGLGVATVALPQPATAQTSATALPAGDAVRTFNVPAGPLDAALDRFARNAGVNLSYDPALIAGHTSRGLSGSHSIAAGLAALLAGSGIDAVAQSGGGYSLRKAPRPAQTQAHPPAGGEPGPTLAPLRVTARSESRPNDLPRPYAGGQVARGTRIGALGNTDFMDAPYSTQSFTRQFIDDRNAQLLSDVVKYDASVLLLNDSSGRSYGDSNFYLRGFQTNEGNASYNGLFGLLSYGHSLEDVERVEIIKGPSAFANGTAGALTVGGLINFVPKRAEDTPLTRLTTRYEPRGNAGAHLDVGRRFGADNAFGLRINLAHREGEVAVKEAEKRYSVAAAALDYRGERARLSLDLAYNNARNVGNDVGLTLPANLPVPRAPDAGRLMTQPWAIADQNMQRAVLRGEWDVSDDWMIGAAYGAAQTDLSYAYCSPTLQNAAGSVNCSGAGAVWRSVAHINSAEVSLNGKLRTGPASHTLTAAATWLENEGHLSSFLNTTPSSFPTSLYDPVYTGAPSIPTVPQPPKTSLTTTSGLVLSDRIGFLDERLSFTLAARQIQIKAENFSATTGAVTSTYDKSAVVPGFGVLGKPWHNVSVYANYVEALEQGGIATAPALNAGAVFPPLKSKQTEAGVKIDHGRFATTFALFRIEKGNQYRDTLSNLYVQDGRQENKGFEVSVFGEPVNGVRIFGGLTWLDATLKRTSGGAFDGKTAPAVPDFTASLSAEWDVPAVLPGLSLTGGAFHSGSAYVNNANTQQIPAWTRYDLGARLATRIAGKNVVTRLTVNNVTDKDYWASVFRNGGMIYLGSPRTVVLSASVDF